MVRELDESDSGLSDYDLLQRLNVGSSRLKQTLKLMAVENPNPIVKIDGRWQRTAQDLAPTFWSRVDRLTQIRREEQAETAAYASHGGCLMRFLQNALDDPTAAECGDCQNCASHKKLTERVSGDLLLKAQTFVRRTFIPIGVHKQFPPKSKLSWAFKKIPEDLRAQPGLALSWYRFGDLGQIVHQQRYGDEPHFSDGLANAAAVMIKRTLLDKVGYITCVPSLGHPTLVPNLTERIAMLLGLPFHAVVTKTKVTSPQKQMLNGSQQVQNLDGAFRVQLQPEMLGKPMILLDDICNSGWTFAVVALLLRQAGSGQVYPVALAKS